MRPMFVHDCDCCKHLGTVLVAGEYYDLYAHPNGSLGPTLMARWGDNGPDYTSSLVQYISGVHSPALRIALAIYQS